MEIHSVEESVIIHYKEGTRVAITAFNGHPETYELGEAMGRKEYVEFFETNKNMRNERPLSNES